MKPVDFRVVSRTSRFASVLFANVINHFANVQCLKASSLTSFRLINCLKNKVSDIFVLLLRYIHLQCSFRFVSETTVKRIWADGMLAKRRVGETISPRSCQFINFG